MEWVSRLVLIEHLSDFLCATGQCSALHTHSELRYFVITITKAVCLGL
jgi:hypothetical protein